MSQHVMIDIESMGTEQDAILTSIGACSFSFKENRIISEFYVRCEWRYGQKGRAASLDTFYWWLDQSPEAQQECRSNGKPLRKVLEDLKEWLPKKPIIWGNGPCFDMSILEHAFKQYDMGIPWKYHSVRCHRTIKMLATGLVEDPVRKGVHHNALGDSIYQAECAMLWAQALRASGSCQDENERPESPIHPVDTGLSKIESKS